VAEAAARQGGVVSVGQMWAAVLATGGVLSYLTAAAIWDLSAWVGRRAQ
jgi:hypothetical protein